jgi:hypothetical protein
MEKADETLTASQSDNSAKDSSLLNSKSNRPSLALLRNNSSFNESIEHFIDENGRVIPYLNFSRLNELIVQEVVNKKLIDEFVNELITLSNK